MCNPIYLRASITPTTTTSEEGDRELSSLNFFISQDPLTLFTIKTLSPTEETQDPSLIHLRLYERNSWAPITVNTETGLRTVLIKVQDLIDHLEFHEVTIRTALREHNIGSLLIERKIRIIEHILQSPLERTLRIDLMQAIRFIEQHRSSWEREQRAHCFSSRKTKLEVTFYAHTKRIELKIHGLSIDYDSLTADYPIHKQFEVYSNITKNQVKAIQEYLLKHKKLLFAHEAHYLKKSDTGLVRSLFISKEGEAFLVKNRKQDRDLLIGKGKYKHVVFAINLSTGERITSASQKITKLIRNEINILQTLQETPNSLKLIGHVSYFSSKRYEKKIRLFTPYYEGGTLYEHIEANALSIKNKKRIFESLIKQVVALHERGILHRDLKPENILLSSNDQDELTPTIIDYGLASFQSQQEELFLYRGTPLYTIPEYLLSYREKGLQPFPATEFNDSWSLGLTLYQLLANDIRCAPFANFTDHTLEGYAKAFLNQHPIYQHPFDPSIRTPLDIVYSLLHRNCYHRITAKRAATYLDQVLWEKTPSTPPAASA